MTKQNENNEDQVIISTDQTEPVETQEPCRSKRIIRPPVKFNLLNEIYQMEFEGLEIDPCDYKEAIQDKDVKQLHVAMKSEMDSMYSNKVWTLVDKPEGIKPIGCKWVYKKKLGPTGKVETFKARLVVKGYIQKVGIDSVGDCNIL